MEHLLHTLTNPYILIVLIIIFAGEYIPYTDLVWKKIGKLLTSFGEWFLTTYENRLYSEKQEWIEDKKVKFELQNFFTKILFFTTATVVVIFLEIFWELGFRKITTKLEKSSFSEWSKEAIKSLQPRIVLILFGLPFIFMETVGVLSFIAITSGHLFLGIGLYLFKVFFFIPVHFILHQGEEQLMSIKWFRIRYQIIINILEWFKKSQSYVRVHNVSEIIKAYLRAVKETFFKRVILIKKAFKHGDVLSPECQDIFNEIKIIENDYKKTDKVGKKSINEILLNLYKKFYICVDKHMDKE